MRTHHSAFRPSRSRIAALVIAASGVLSPILWPTDARAQLAGTSNAPLPNVLLLVDTSGSMERMGDGSLPSASPLNRCKVGTGVSDMVSEPNRWGMLLQALTGNLQPYFACEEVNRDAGPTSAFVREYSIGGRAPYDAAYFMPYHRPMTGTSDSTACAMAPYILPGTATGVGPNTRGDNSLLASDFNDDAVTPVLRSYLNSTNRSLAVPLPGTGAKCIFDQAPDGQLDAVRDYARFALMTFDNDINEHTGIDSSKKVDFSTVSLGVPPVLATPQPPFLGQWSYLRSPDNPLWGSGSTITGGTYPGSVQGHPLACPFTPFEVGARDENAPPWEGRLVKFPNPDASLYDIQLVNEQIQKVLLASRPYGATPIDGMMDDARDYYWYKPGGPKEDKYLCRNKYIVLLTDGAPNLDLRPSCGTGDGDVCPYPDNAAEIARKLKNAPTETARVTTFVIGFSVNGSGTFPGDGFPTGYKGTGLPANPPGKNNCKSWYDGAGLNSPTQMAAVCNQLYGIDPPGANQIPAGSTADACCKLNEIALKGSDPLAPTGPYFAESQADIVLSFGKIMANIIKSASTKTVPAFTPTAQFSVDSFSSNATSGQFIASFIPNTQRPWSGELDRTRYQCKGSPLVSTPVLPQEPSKGDLMSVNLAGQSKTRERFFITVKADEISGGSIDSAATVRPFANVSSSPTADGIPSPDNGGPTYSGTEISMRNDLSIPTKWDRALNIDDATCKRSRAIKKGTGAGPRGTVIVPALTAPHCTEAIWGFATAYPGKIEHTGIPTSAPAYDFNIRCTGGQSATVGTCSVSGTTCNVDGSLSCPEGEVCVPECSALGAIYKSNPTVVGPPSGFLREEGFRSFQSARRTRGITTFVATADGMLHAFKAMDEVDPSHSELWSFVPPAILPKLASNYPSGNQILLDGSPIVRETVWNRKPGDSSPDDWHTTLVAGLGAGGGGYYALNVTDADCGGGNPLATPPKVAGNCYPNGAWEDPGKGLIADVSTSGVIGSTHKKGPHFLWQLTDVLKVDGESAKIVRKNHQGYEMVGLFGKQTGTPAIGMIQVKLNGEERQVGVAILPGGLENPPIKGGVCDRAGTGSALAMHDDTAIGAVRGQVRQWAKTCTDPVPGRGVTIVRLDNGEIIRHFGRTVDTPERLHPKLKVTPFDSPMIGVPVVYPDSVGVPIQKVFIGDADGTMWRIDLTNTDPAAWSASLFQDLYATSPATAGQPIQVPPVLSTDDTGLLVINVATGDQDSIVLSADKNYVYSITEKRQGTDIKAYVNWYKQLHDDSCAPGADPPLSCEARVTGPMVVFDRTLYFATYTPNPPTGNTCGAPGFAKLWGLHYTERDAGATSAGAGGLPRYCVDGQVNGVTGLCDVAYQYNQIAPAPFANDMIPGVALRTAQSCSSFGNTFDESGSSVGFSSVTPSEYHLSFGVAKPSTTNGQQAARPTAFRRPVPRVSTKIDAWALVVE